MRSGRLISAEEGVYAVAPLLEHDEWGHWMGATLTAPGSVLSHTSAATAWDIWSLPRPLERVTRPGSGGPRQLGGVLVHRSSTIAGASTSLRGIPITTVPRTLLDLAGGVRDRALARSVREAVRLELVTAAGLGDALGRLGAGAVLGVWRKCWPATRGCRSRAPEAEPRFVPSRSSATPATLRLG